MKKRMIISNVFKLLGSLMMMVGMLFAMLDSDDWNVYYRSKAISAVLLIVGTLIVLVASKIENAINRRQARKGQNKLHHDYSMEKEANQ